eukprot:m.82833 g.82833  ORF g.82833 m.82833 type:complete len:353 (+) comp13419_c5_seq1:1086-2144(+)
MHVGESLRCICLGSMRSLDDGIEFVNHSGSRATCCADHDIVRALLAPLGVLIKRLQGSHTRSLCLIKHVVIVVAHVRHSDVLPSEPGEALTVRRGRGQVVNGLQRRANATEVGLHKDAKRVLGVHLLVAHKHRGRERAGRPSNQLIGLGKGDIGEHAFREQQGGHGGVGAGLGEQRVQPFGVLQITSEKTVVGTAQLAILLHNLITDGRDLVPEQRVVEDVGCLAPRDLDKVDFKEGSEARLLLHQPEKGCVKASSQRNDLPFRIMLEEFEQRLLDGNGPDVVATINERRASARFGDKGLEVRVVEVAQAGHAPLAHDARVVCSLHLHTVSPFGSPPVLKMERWRHDLLIGE